MCVCVRVGCFFEFVYVCEILRTLSSRLTCNYFLCVFVSVCISCCVFFVCLRLSGFVCGCMYWYVCPCIYVCVWDSVQNCVLVRLCIRLFVFCVVLACMC